MVCHLQQLSLYGPVSKRLETFAQNGEAEGATSDALCSLRIAILFESIEAEACYVEIVLDTLQVDLSKDRISKTDSLMLVVAKYHEDFDLQISFISLDQ